MKLQQGANAIPVETSGFNGTKDMKAYDLNRMCHSFNSPDNCKKFKDFPEAYCHTFNLKEEEIHAVTDLDIIRMVKTGAEIAYLAKLTDIYGLNVYDLGAQQAGISLPKFEALLLTLSK